MAAKWRGASGREKNVVGTFYCLVSFLFRLNRKMEGLPVWKTLDRSSPLMILTANRGYFPGLLTMRLFVLPSRLVGISQVLRLVIRLNIRGMYKTSIRTTSI